MSRANCMPVHIRGKDYPSVNEAAAALGIKPASLSSYLSRYGHTEGVGLGCSSPARNKYPRNKKPVDIAGHQFATVKAAADALGVNYQALARTLKRPLSEKSARRLLRLVNAWKARKAAEVDDAMRKAWAASMRKTVQVDRAAMRAHAQELARKNALNHPRADEIAQAYRDGVRTADIAREYGISNARISALVEVLGIPRRSERVAA